MTLHSFRRRSRPPDWDATTITFAGASGAAPAPVTMTRAAPRPHFTPLEAPAPPEPAPPQRPYDAAMPAILRDGTFGLLCGMDRWRIHFDPEAARCRHMFDALRVSALRAGWRPDAYGRWCCHRCVMDPAYAAAKPLAHWHADSAAMRLAGDPAAESWFRAAAEHALIRQVRDSRCPVRWHLVRPGPRFVAVIITRQGDVPYTARHSRHQAGAR